MLSNYYTLAVLAEDLNRRLRGKSIGEAYTQEKDEAILAFDGASLLVSCTPEINTLYLYPDFARARRNSTNVLKAAAGIPVLSVRIQPMDRALTFELADTRKLHILLFRQKANILLVDGEDRIVDSFKDSRTLVGTQHQFTRGDLVQDVAALRSLRSAEASIPLSALLKRASPVLGQTLATEILFRSGLEGTAKALAVSDDAFTRLETAFTSVLTDLARPDALVYVEKAPPHTPFRFSLVRLDHCTEYEEKSFPDIHAALRFFVARTRSAGNLHAHATGVLATLRQHQLRISRSLAAVEEDLRNSTRADDYDTYANLLMTYPGEVQKGMSSVTYNENGNAVTVPLDIRLTPIQNAQRYFEKARKARLARGQSGGRLNDLRSQLAAVQRLLAEAGEITTTEEMKRYMEERSEELTEFGIGKKAEERELLPFRIFTVDGGFEVWAGKSSRNNDELTMKHAKPNDLWFHARGSSGSHVILKTGSGNGEPGKKAREQAAAIAAYYSKMKNAKMVPVAMTERKYVRKPKGSPPGSVVLDREKVIFAEPALPEESGKRKGDRQ
jgi:predicted ribosome quality control (RQC) complex YloA/Tae2 family protein